MVGPTDQEIVFFCSQCPRVEVCHRCRGYLGKQQGFSKEAERTGDRKKAGTKHSLVVSLKRNGQKQSKEV